MTDKLVQIPDEWYQLAEKNGISRVNVRQRYYTLDWPLEKACTTPVHARLKTWRRFQEKASRHGVGRRTFYSRLQRGMSPEEAAVRPIRRGKRYNDDFGF